MKFVSLPSKEIVNLDVLLSSLEEIGWGWNDDIHSIIAFGSAARPLEFVDTLVYEKYRSLWTLGVPIVRSCIRSIAKPPNDIDLLVIYNQKIIKKQSRIKHQGQYGVLRAGDYSNWVETNCRVCNLDLQCVSLETFKRAAFKNDKFFQNVVSDGIVIYGENNMVAKKAEIIGHLLPRDARIIKVLPSLVS